MQADHYTAAETRRPLTGPRSHNTGEDFPRVPTLFRPEPDPTERFVDLKRLCQRVAKLRRKRPLRIQASPRTQRGGATFPAFDLFAIEADGSEVWLGSAAIQTRERRVLEMALEKADPQ